MGYTHYHKTKKVTTKVWTSFITDCKRLHKSLPETTNTAGGYYSDKPLKIAGGDGTGKPCFDIDMVIFNGRDGKDDLSHETFCVQNKDGGDFCKTARKPYDLLVVACLIAGWKKNVLRFSSDGFNQDGTCDDLQPAIDYYNEVIKPETPVTQLDLAKQRKEYKEID